MNSGDKHEFSSFNIHSHNQEEIRKASGSEAKPFRVIESERNLIQTPISTTKGGDSSKLSEKQKKENTFTSSSKDSGSNNTN